MKSALFMIALQKRKNGLYSRTRTDHLMQICKTFPVMAGVGRLSGAYLTYPARSGIHSDRLAGLFTPFRRPEAPPGRKSVFNMQFKFLNHVKNITLYAPLQ